MAQLEKIEVIVEWRWVLKESPCDHREESEVGEEDGDNEEASGKVRRRGLHCLPPISIVILFS